MLQVTDDDYIPLSQSPRGRGRGRGSGRGGLASTPGRMREAEHGVADDGQLQSDDDVVMINSVKLGKRFAPAHVTSGHRLSSERVSEQHLLCQVESDETG